MHLECIHSLKYFNLWNIEYLAVLTGWLEGQKEEDISKSECATKVICREGAIKGNCHTKAVGGQFRACCPFAKDRYNLIVSLEVILQWRDTTDEQGKD